MTTTQAICTVTSVVIAVCVLPSRADYRDNSKAIKVSGGEDHTLVLTADKGAWACGPNGGYAFGYHYYGVLGTGSNDYNLEQKTLVRVHDGAMGTESERLGNINDIAAGWMHSLALEKYDPCDPNYMGFVWSWGWNSEGQLGDGTPYARTTPVKVRGPNDAGYLQYIDSISAGRSGRHSLAVDANGYAYAWGYNKYGQCGNGEFGDGERELTPLYVHQGTQADDPNDANNPLEHIVDICAGADQSIALETDDPADPNFSGCVYTWGTNRWGDDPWDEGIVSLGYGLLGTASDVNFSATPVKVLAGAQHPDEPSQPYLNHIVAVAAGWDHCMALEKDDPYDPNIYNPAYTGRVFTWGNNGPGWGGGDPCNLPEEVSVGGRLGNGTYNNSNVPVLVLSGEQDPGDPNSPLEHIMAISAGEGHSMALDIDGRVYCWGDNQYGQLGNGGNEPCSAPVRVVAGMQNREDPNSPLSGIVAISAGHWHSLAIDSNGVVWVWGKTKDGRLGLANMANAYPCYSSIPHRIPVVYNQTQETFAFGMQAAVTGADDGDLLRASAGTYYENVELFDTNITLESMDPNNGDVVADTIIDAHYNSAYSYTVDFESGSDCTFAGFTLTNGNYEALHCGGSSSVNITDCRIENNAGWVAIRINASSASITDSRIQNNSSPIYSVYGIYCENGSTVSISDCNIAWNTAAGIYCLYSSIRLANCMIQDNGDHGIYDYNSADASVITNNIIRGNADNGIYSERFSSGPQIKNNWIYSNGGSGIKTYNPSAPPDTNAAIVNNTIVNNNEYGVESDWATDAEITSTIIWGNGSSPSDNLHATNGTFSVAYSCVEGGYAGTDNITSDPRFVDEDFNNFHLGGGSACIDKGDPDFEPEPDDMDIDGEYRIINERVDMGADEFCRATDFNGDGLVNFVDYSMLVRHWKQEDTDAGYSDAFDLWDDDVIDFNDVMVLCEDWLVTAECRTESMLLMGGRGGAGMVEGLGFDAELSAVAVAEREPGIAEPVDIEAIMKWLAEIWLDPEVRKAIDEDAWSEFLESLWEYRKLPGR